MTTWNKTAGKNTGSVSMDANRYSLRTVGNLLGMTAMAIRNRAQRLGIDTANGLTAENVKAIRSYKGNLRYAKKHSQEDLVRELEELGWLT